jgi:hypothetical protein
MQTVILGVAGGALCMMWRQSISSYKDLNSGKFEIINAMEEFLPIAVYETEWEILERGSNTRRFRPFHRVEVQVPWLFVALYVATILTEVDIAAYWQIIGEKLGAILSSRG